jgi:hypothetical protein
MSGPAGSRDHQPRGIRAQSHDPIRRNARSPERAKESCAFLLTKTYMEVAYSDRTSPFSSTVRFAGYTPAVRVSPQLVHEADRYNIRRLHAHPDCRRIAERFAGCQSNQPAAFASRYIRQAQ